MSLTVITFLSSIAPPSLADVFSSKLSQSGASVLSPVEYKQGIADGIDLHEERLVFFIGTGGTEKLVADFVDELNIVSPIILFSHHANNSLPAAMEIRTYLEMTGLDVIIIHLPLQGLIDTLSRWLEYEQHLDKIRNSRLGLIGSPSFWLIASNVNRKQVTQKWGIEFVDYDLDLLKRAPINENQIFEKYQRDAARIEIPEEELKKAATIALRLEELMDSEELNAVAVQCFDFLIDTSVSGCLALSHINNTPGRIAGCEGDVPTAFTMLVARFLTGSPSFMANVTEVDLATNSVVFAHCTVATSIVKEYELTTHFETNKSVGIRGTFEKQMVTIFKIFGDELLDYWVTSGTIVENRKSDDGCRTQIRVELDTDVSYFLERSLANHHIVIPGNHVEVIDDFFSFVYLRG